MVGIPGQILDPFLRVVRARSAENWTSFGALLKERNFGNAIALLRLEIDTFLRLVYLQSVDDVTASTLISDFLKGRRWKCRVKSKVRLVRDRDMVNLAKREYFWVEIAYDFGCQLIHLSKIHDYETVDPFAMMAPQAKQTIIDFLREYHQYQGQDIDLPRFVAVVPKVMGKIRGKVRAYSSALEQRGKSCRK